MKILACFAGFEFYPVKYWKVIAHNLLVIIKEESNNINFLFVFVY
jgi:hypothetical protein